MDADKEMVGMTLSVLSKVLWATGIPIASPITLQLAERLQPLFDSDANHVQLLSMHLFRDVMELVAEEGKKPLKQHVHQSLIPLLCHLHDENQRVAEASRETLLQATKFLKNRKLQQLLEREQTWVVGKCLVRMAPTPQSQPGQAPCPQCPVRGAGSCAPARCCSPSPPACPPTHAPFPRACGPVDSSPGSSPSSSPGCRRRSPSPAGLWQQGGTAAPQGAPSPLLPPNPGTGRLLAGRQGCPGRKGGVQGAPDLGAESAPTLPSIPLCSLQLAEYSSRVDEYLQQSLLYLESPQASMRAAAIRFLGLAGRHVMHQQVKLQVIYKALQSTTKDVSLSVSSLATQTLFLLRAAERNPPSRFRLPVLQERFCRAWRRCPSLWDNGFLCCWSSVQS
ncbi:uncharacterized protein LOC128144586 isoform X1 [Harpia harpyja]|uniref:uncharacterized protein LOC128144586 isoform X1 n=1 Tax=Harpia harpyja TaxID=202280 RepID=UPI0022B2055B|nr:uncharacterized protein LOC128144586 isoform X1 [Harpia harpyja]